MMPLQVATQGGERGELASGAGGRRGGSEVGCGGGVLVGTATCGVEAVAGEEGHCASIESADGEETTRVLSSIEKKRESVVGPNTTERRKKKCGLDPERWW